METFTEFVENGRFEKLSVDADQTDKLVKLLDAFVIKLEGGSDADLLVLDEPPVGAEAAPSAPKMSAAGVAKVASEAEPRPVSADGGEDGEMKDDDDDSDSDQKPTPPGEEAPKSGNGHSPVCSNSMRTRS